MIMADACEFVDFVIEELNNRNDCILWDSKKEWTADWNNWMDELEALIK